MSALTPHIRVLCAEAEALRQEAVRAAPRTAQVLFALVKSKLAAADALEAEERQREEKLDG